ncbi:MULTISPECIES: helix-turn-helix transcriptional regulator [unclassified Streptomyces]|uniref:helix-turn-helix domain-containing protein n=1 Tax=unclassified Streptomyces TaxID=2593676 RepID=UPI00225542C2|nr:MULTISPECIES: helix-turn-helix transcriptional regulator [unclassified Streptomyces]MCX5061485.1 helix-turn-helix transcriptional regulator [Streptomyces sp. NBC_00452]MCX5292901.1 helix-turn-helix transcriptional regulator [Streptomyces sp. NBC_00183]
MRQRPTRPNQPAQPPPPFNAQSARRLRTALDMGPEHVAYGLRVSYGLPYITPDLVVAWERGQLSPSDSELAALAGVLWCSPGELIGKPRTLREHRIARRLAPEDIARSAGLELLAYLHMEEHNSWRGNERQSAALAELLRLSLPDFISVTGREGKLTELLRSAASTRWQAYVRPVGKVVPLDRRLLEDSLQQLHQDYQGQMVASLSWGDGTAANESSDLGRDFLDRIVDHFWAAVQDNTE